PALTVVDQVLTWGALAHQVQFAAGALIANGVRAGDRVAILVPPGPQAIAIVYACWRIGAVVVIADRGLGVRGMRRALRAALPDHVIGIRAGRLLARTLGLPGRILDPRDLLRGPAITLPEGPHPEDLAAVVFTSGSTGPAKGVRYRHHQIARTCALLREHYALNDADVLIAAFAPWAILGPALGIASVIPDMDVTAPASLRAGALADAVKQAGGTVLWASPAALTSVLRTATADMKLPTLRLVLGAGAPVPAQLLESLAPLFPNAQLRTPYGMTEALPVSDVTIDDIRAAGLGPGVLVGRPVPGVRIQIDPLVPGGSLGEICVQAPHMRDGYDHLWGINAAASSPRTWHRTGDVGVLESSDLAPERLWVAGRRAHVVWTVDGPIAPVPIEQRVQTLPWVQWAAVVGVGPVGTQQIVVIVVPKESHRRAVSDRRPWVGAARSSQVRECVQPDLGLPIAAVLQRRSFPVDVRHQAKIDRTLLATWAGKTLAGREGGR
ncbi:MAG: AMP-binding protein, partial [Actinomycetales bacterium]